MDRKKKEGRGNEQIRRLYFQSGQGFFSFPEKHGPLLSSSNLLQSPH